MTLPAGWGWPANARKAHWFDEDAIVSLCRRWMYSGTREPDAHRSPDDCAPCRRLVDARTATP